MRNSSVYYKCPYFKKQNMSQSTFKWIEKVLIRRLLDLAGGKYNSEPDTSTLNPANSTKRSSCLLAFCPRAKRLIVVMTVPYYSLNIINHNNCNSHRNDLKSHRNSAQRIHFTSFCFVFFTPRSN